MKAGRVVYRADVRFVMELETDFSAHPKGLHQLLRIGPDQQWQKAQQHVLHGSSSFSIEKITKMKTTTEVNRGKTINI
ncbi:hypothetical protein ACFX1T_018106 [Malus domestica]